MGDLNPFPDILHTGHGQIVLSFWASISTSASCNSNTSFLTLLWKLEAMLPKSALGIDWHIWWHSALLLLLSLLWLVWIWLEWHHASGRGSRRENPKETSGRVSSVSMPFGPPAIIFPSYMGWAGLPCPIRVGRGCWWPHCLPSSKCLHEESLFLWVRIAKEFSFGVCVSFSKAFVT